VATVSYRRVNPGPRFEDELNRSASGWNESALKSKFNEVSTALTEPLVTVISEHTTADTNKTFLTTCNSFPLFENNFSNNRTKKFFHSSDSVKKMVNDFYF
jgi:hypothetical protein